jgi:hypothetical protein
MGYKQRWVKEVSEWANGTVEVNGVWKSEGVAIYTVNGTIFERKKVIKYKMYFDFLYKFCLKYFSLQEELSEIPKMCVDIHIQRKLFLSNIIEIFSTDFRKILEYQIS